MNFLHIQVVTTTIMYVKCLESERKNTFLDTNESHSFTVKVKIMSFGEVSSLAQYLDKSQEAT